MKKTNVVFLGILAFMGVSLAAGATSSPFTNKADAAPKTNTDGTGYSFELTSISNSDYVTIGNMTVSGGKAISQADVSSYIGTYAPYKQWTLEFDVRVTSSFKTFFGFVFGSSNAINNTSYSNNSYYGFGSDSTTFSIDGCTTGAKAGWDSPYKSINTLYTVRAVGANNQVRVYLGTAGGSLNLLAAVSDGYVHYDGSDCYIGRPTTGYIGIVTNPNATGIEISRFKMINNDPTVIPDEITDTTPQKTFNYNPGESISGYLSSSISNGVSYSITSDPNNLLSLNSSTGRWTFNPTLNTSGAYNVAYKMTAGDNSVTGNLVFNQKNRINAPLLTKYTPSPVYKFHIRNFDENVMPITGWVAPMDHVGCNTQEKYNEFRDAGLNIAIANAEKASSTAAIAAAGYAQNAGISYIANAGLNFTETTIQNLYDFDSFVGVLTRDEPGINGFSDQITARQKLDDYGAKDILNYCNILPIAAGQHQLDTGEWIGGDALSTTSVYQNYVSQYISVAKPAFISYDYYANRGQFPNLIYISNTSDTEYFNNLKIIADSAHNAHIPFMNFALATGHMSYRIPRESELQWEVNTTLAYGAKGMQYFCYQMPWDPTSSTAQSWGQYYGGSFIDYSGNKTSTYYHGQTINNQLHRMEHVLMNSTKVGLKYLNGGEADFVKNGGATLGGSFREMKSVTSTGNLLMGCFDYNGKTAIYFVNNDIQSALTANVTFSNYVEGNMYMKDGNFKMNGSALHLALGAGEGMLLELTNYASDYEHINVVNPTITLAQDTYDYTGSPITPVPTITYAGTTLVKDTDYTLSYEDNDKGGTATINIEFIGRYAGQANKKFTIVNKTISYVAPTAISGLVYNGNPQPLINAGNCDNNGELRYSLNNQTSFSTAIPNATSAGTYTVYYKAFATTSGYEDSAIGSLEITIDKRPIEFDGMSTQSKTYTGSSLTPTAPSIRGNYLGIDSIVIKDQGGAIINEAVDVGNYTFSYIVNSTDNFIGGTFTIDFTISPKLYPDVTKNPQGKDNLVFNGQSQDLITTGQVSNGIFKYSLDNINWSETVPSVTDSGIYTVYAKVFGNDGFEDILFNPIVVSIARANVTLDNYPTGINIEYDGLSHPLVNNVASNLGHFEYRTESTSYSSSLPSAIDSGSYTIFYRFVFNNPNNYNPIADGTIYSRISKINPNVDYDAEQTYKYSGSAITPIVPTAEGQNVILLKIEDVLGDNVAEIKNIGEYTLTYEIEGDTNHRSAQVSISVKVTRSAQFIIDRYIKPSDVDLPSEQILGRNGKYKAAKDALLKLNNDEINEFKLDLKYEAARNQYLSWAKISLDDKPYEVDNSYLEKQNAKGGCGGSVEGIAAISIVAIAGLASLTYKKRKLTK